MRAERLGQPCRNFNILGIARLRDPKDGREKVVLSNFASGATGSVILVDPATGTGETIPLPGDEGAWALLCLDDETLLVGTCARFGYLHRLDLRARRWSEPLCDEAERYIWNLALASDGMVYGGTWPGGRLLRYDPRRHSLENLGPVSPNAGNQYTRTVCAGSPGRLVIACGYAEPHLAVWELAKGRASRFGRPGAAVREVNARFICTESDGILEFHDSRTLERLERAPASGLAPAVKLPFAGMSHHVVLGDGRIFATHGQEYCLFEPSAAVDPRAVELQPVPSERPATRIHTIVSDDLGRIWGSSGFGQTIFRFDPVTKDTWNSSGVTDSGGEVYGMAFVGGRLFMSAYAGGDHIVYDARLPWDQVGNVNPKTLAPVGPALIRPSGWSVVGPDGQFWTGWMARYGVYGGGISRVDVETLAMTSWNDAVPGQPVVGLAADHRFLYLVTGAGGNGLPARTIALAFAVLSIDGRVAWRHDFAPGEMLRVVCAHAGRVLVPVDSRLMVFDPDAMRFERSIPFDGPCQCVVGWDVSAAAVFRGEELWRVEPVSGATTLVCRLPGEVSAAAVTPSGVLHAATGTDLYRLAD